jgi:hypothetical protein
VKKSKGRSRLESLDINRRIILKWIFSRVTCVGMDLSAAGGRPDEWVVPADGMVMNGFILMQLIALFESCATK